MKVFAWLLGLACFCCVGLLGFALYIVATSPSCDEQGGTLVQTGTITQILLVGKVMIPQVVPLYKCVPGVTNNDAQS